jgi:hypothetical protein
MNADDVDEQTRLLWRAQPVPALQPLSAEALLAQAQRLQQRLRRRNRRELVAGALVALVFLVYAVVFPHWLSKLGALLTVAGVGYTLWQLQRRAAGVPSAAALGASVLQCHRAELVRQRDALQAVWRWYVAPLVPGLVLFLCGRQIENGRWHPGLFAICAVVLGLVVWLNRLAARRLQKRIDTLDNMATEDHP